MKVNKLSIDGLYAIDPLLFDDNRGYFYESFNQKEFLIKTGLDLIFVQENVSYSKKNVLRGLHYQINMEQGKLIKVISGLIYDVAVDLRKTSPNFGQYVGMELSSENRKQFWIPEGFAHGFLVLSDEAVVSYKLTEYWSKPDERSIIWNDKDIDIKWPIKDTPILSDKDQNASRFESAICM